jgi:hypothetical protein
MFDVVALILLTTMAVGLFSMAVMSVMIITDRS